MTAKTEPISLYQGKVMHARLKPKPHRFTYSMVSMLIDLDRLDEANSVSPLFSVNQPNLIAFHEKHHGKRDGSNLRAFADELLQNAGLTAARIELLCYPSVLGYTFNPISVYFCRDESERIIALIYQVHNTFGESHCYVEPVRPGQVDKAGIRQECDKQFYVSPFLEMAMRYRFRILPPEGKVAIRILETDQTGPILSATFHGRHAKATTSVLARMMLQYLGITWKVTAAIHLEALKLWLKGIKLTVRPAAGAAVSYANKESDDRWNSLERANRQSAGDRYDNNGDRAGRAAPRQIRTA